MGRVLFSINLSVASLLFLSFPVAAAGPPTFDVAMTIGSLILVIGIILGLAWLLKKMQLPVMAGSKELAIVKQIPVGGKERIAVVRAGEAQFLVGITAHSINLIAPLEQSIGADKAAEAASNESNKFARQFNQLLKRHDDQ